MGLKEEYLSIKNIDDITPEQEVKFYNELDWKDEEILDSYIYSYYNEEILKHYRFLTKDVDFEKEDEKLKEDLEHGFEIPWLLRKEKFN